MSATATGYVYADETDKVMASAGDGTRIAIEMRHAPFITVYDSIESVGVARWPGRLWQVRAIETASQADQRAARMTPPSSGTGFTRAVAIEVIQEIPASRLFGVNGDKICAVLARAGQLDWDQANYLAKTRHPDAGRAYSRAWSNWLLSVGVASPFRIDFFSVVDTSTLRDHDFTGVLGTSAHPGSPINHGLKVLHRTIHDRAEKMTEIAAICVDEHGEQNLGPVWLIACYALLEAAMALGAPEISSEEDRRIMCKAWHSMTSPNLLTS